MARINVVSGPEGLLGKEFLIPDDKVNKEALFLELMNKKCFWTVDTSGLGEREIFEVKIFDFVCRCTRSIFMKIPIVINGRRILVLSASRKSVDRALKMIIDMLELSNGDIRIVSDDNHGLKMETIPGIDSLHTIEDCFFARA